MKAATSRRRELADEPSLRPWHMEWKRQLPSPGCRTTRAEPCRSTSTGPDCIPSIFFSLARFASGCLSRALPLNHGHLSVLCLPSHASHFSHTAFPPLDEAAGGAVAGPAAVGPWEEQDAAIDAGGVDRSGVVCCTARPARPVARCGGVGVARPVPLSVPRLPTCSRTPTRPAPMRPAPSGRSSVEPKPRLAVARLGCSRAPPLRKARSDGTDDAPVVGVGRRASVPTGLLTREMGVVAELFPPLHDDPS